MCEYTHTRTNAHISLRLYHATLGVIQTISRECGVARLGTSVCEFVCVCEREKLVRTALSARVYLSVVSCHHVSLLSAVSAS